MNRCLLLHVTLAMLLSLDSLAEAQDPAPDAKLPEAQPTEPVGVPAALEERYRKMAEQLQQDLPKRELKVKVTEAQKTPLLRADPKVLENKFLGRLELKPARVDFANHQNADSYIQRLQMDRAAMRNYPDELFQLLFVYGDRPLLHFQGSLGNSVQGRLYLVVGKMQLSDHFQLLLKQCTAELAPDQRTTDYLTSADCYGDVALIFGDFQIRLSDGSFKMLHHLHYLFLAPTADEVEKRAQAIVRLYDAGLSRPMQRYLVGEGQKALDAARKSYLELAQLTQAARAEEEKLAKPSEISGDILSQLKAQKVMVAVELAGLNARVKACDAMLADPKKLEISTLQSISDMKIKAEIERVGIKEKLDQINVFIAEGDLRTAARARQIELGAKVSNLRGDIKLSERSAMQYAELFELYAPFQIPDNQITIGPIEWSQQ